MRRVAAAAGVTAGRCKAEGLQHLGSSAEARWTDEQRDCIGVAADAEEYTFLYFEAAVLAAYP
jgi:hypothetical protein